MNDQTNMRYYILLDGQKNGPFSKEDITQKIHNKDILFTDQVSIDEGKSWSNLFELDGFNRRTFARNDELPHLPDQDVFDEDAKNVTRILRLSDHSSIDATVALAHIGNISGSGANSGNSSKKIHNEDYTNDDNNHDEVISEEEIDEIDLLDSVEKKKRGLKDLKWVALFIFSLIGLKLLYTSEKNNLSNQKISKKSKQFKSKNIKARSSKNNDLRLSKKKRSLTKNSRKRFQNSSSFKKAARKGKRLSNNPRKMRFSNERNPAQSHPQRRKLSRETLNPEDEEYREEDEYEEEYQDEYDEENEDGHDSNQKSQKKKSKRKSARSKNAVTNRDRDRDRDNMDYDEEEQMEEEHLDEMDMENNAEENNDGQIEDY